MNSIRAKRSRNALNQAPRGVIPINVTTTNLNLCDCALMTDTNEIFQANLAVLRLKDAALAEAIESTESAALNWTTSKAGPITAMFEGEGRPQPMASQYDPLNEAEQLLKGVDHTKHACVVVLGAGLGYHLAKLVEQQKGDGLLVVFEPDLAIFRAALERIDHRRWLGRSHMVLCGPDTDRASLMGKMETYAGSVTQGTILVTHPPTRRRHGEALTRFTQEFTEVTSFFRTNVATALVNASRTCYNQSCNLPHYVAGETINNLQNAAKGVVAVCVGAGPSLAKNVHLLQDPAIRRRVIVISAQTTLKPLLDRGVRPDFVTALDYSEISSRFYENLPDLPDVTLVIEPKGHPAIVDAFPGPVRVTHTNFLDRMLGELKRPITPTKQGATVAHLSFYLAQFLGCDPIVLIGQDLGFSDGLYYAPGTAIHDVWAPELNAFNTLENMEWARIMRHKRHLKRLEDIHGRPVFSDEQMVTYLKQFERDFAVAPQKVIDATEGGLSKQHTEVMTLADAIAQYALQDAPPLPPASRHLDVGRLDAATQLMTKRISETQILRRLCVKSIPILNQMLKCQKNKSRFDKLFDKIKANQRRVHGELGATFSLVNELNVIGAFKRARADRVIAYQENDDEKAVQAAQLERDIENVDWLRQACDEALEIFNTALERTQTAMKREQKVKQPRARSVAA